jgi:hypothetical protein
MNNLNKQVKHIQLIFFSIFLSIIFMVSACSNKHKVANFIVGTTVKLNSDILIGAGECVLKKFEGTSINNKFYMYWTFQSNSNQFFFEIESSTTGKKFKHYCFKRGYVSPGSSSLMLCVTDSTTKNNIVYYRIKTIPENGSVKSNESKEYKALFEASTIMLTKNKKTKGYMQDEPVSATHYHAMK